jgi:hypothetical protein
VAVISDDYCRARLISALPEQLSRLAISGIVAMFATLVHDGCLEEVCDG